jgi:Mg-chelatase subunit ChlD
MDLRTEYTRMRLQVRARALSQDYRAGVEWAGSAYTDGRTIFLPGKGCGPIDALGEVELLLSLHALVIHEAAHLRYSSFEVLKSIGKLPAEEQELTRHVLNIIEDARVELLISNSHPGTRDYLRFFNDLALKTWLPSLDEVKAPGEQFLQALAQKTITGRLKGTPTAEVTKVLEEVMPMVQEARKSPDPWKAFEVAKQIVGKIKGKWGIPRPPQVIVFRFNVPDGCRNTAREAENHAREDLAGRTLEELHEGEGDTGKSTGDGDCEKKGTTMTGATPRGGDKDEKEVLPRELAESIKAEIRKAEKEHMEKMREIRVDEESIGASAKGVAVTSRLADNRGRSEYHAIAREVAPQLKRLLPGLREILAANTRTRRGLKKGKLDPTRIHRVAYGRQDVYYKRSAKGQESVGFLLLVDESGSMSTSKRYLQARKAAILFSEVLRELRISHMVVGFTADEGSGLTADHIVYRTFSEKPARPSYSLAGISARLNNRDGASIRVATEYLGRQRFRKKVLIVISDGEPYARLYSPPRSVADTAKAVREAMAKGIRVIGVSIDPGAGHYLHNIYPSRVIVKRLEELPAKLLKVARRELV